MCWVLGIERWNKTESSCCQITLSVVGKKQTLQWILYGDIVRAVRKLSLGWSGRIEGGVLSIFCSLDVKVLLRVTSLLLEHEQGYSDIIIWWSRERRASGVGRLTEIRNSTLWYKQLLLLECDVCVCWQLGEWGQEWEEHVKKALSWIETPEGFKQVVV